MELPWEPPDLPLRRRTERETCAEACYEPTVVLAATAQPRPISAVWPTNRPKGQHRALVRPN
jgi:hypothetical protein